MLDETDEGRPLHRMLPASRGARKKCEKERVALS